MNENKPSVFGLFSFKSFRHRKDKYLYICHIKETQVCYNVSIALNTNLLLYCQVYVEPSQEGEVYVDRWIKEGCRLLNVDLCYVHVHCAVYYIECFHNNSNTVLLGLCGAGSGRRGIC